LKGEALGCTIWRFGFWRDWSFRKTRLRNDDMLLIKLHLEWSLMYWLYKIQRFGQVQSFTNS
jgi:hypothetical protein